MKKRTYRLPVLIALGLIFSLPRLFLAQDAPMPSATKASGVALTEEQMAQRSPAYLRAQVLLSASALDYGTLQTYLNNALVNSDVKIR